MRVVLSGASGLIGEALVASLRGDGHEVTRLVRRAARGDDEVQWRPDAGELDQARVQEAIERYEIDPEAPIPTTV